MWVLNKNMKIIRGVILAVVFISSFNAKAYIDDNQEQLSVDDIVQIVDSKGYNHGGLLHASGSLKNISDIDNVKVTVTIEFSDANKNVLKSIESVKDDLDAGEIWSFDVAALSSSVQYYSISYIEIEY